MFEYKKIETYYKGDKETKKELKLELNNVVWEDEKFD